MDTEALRLFLEVCRTGNITAAASNLYTTQSTLSKRLVLLEKELGVQLFQRGKGKAQAVITPAGEAFVDIAQRMETLYQQALTLREDTRRQHITIGCIRSVQDYLLPGLLLRLEAKEPDFCFTMEDHHSAEIFSLVKAQRIDIGFVQSPAPYPDLVSTLLYEEDYRVVLWAENGLFAPGTAVPANCLPVEHEIFQAFDSEFLDWHSQWWQPAHAKIRVNTTPTAERYFHTKQDWMIVPAAVAQALEEKGFCSYPLREKPPRHHVYLVYRKRTTEPGLIRFAAEAGAYFGEYGS